MTSNCVEALAPFSDTAISKINLSSSLGKNGPREIVLDIERSKIRDPERCIFSKKRLAVYEDSAMRVKGEI